MRWGLPAALRRTSGASLVKPMPSPDSRIARCDRGGIGAALPALLAVVGLKQSDHNQRLSTYL